MGTYVYSVRAKEIAVELAPKTTPVIAREAEYLCKPAVTNFLSKGKDPAAKLIDRAKLNYERKGRAAYIFIKTSVDGIYRLFEYDSSTGIFYDDDFFNNNESIGYVRKQGRGKPFEVLDVFEVMYAGYNKKIAEFATGQYKMHVGSYGKVIDSQVAYDEYLETLKARDEAAYRYELIRNV